MLTIYGELISFHENLPVQGLRSWICVFNLYLRILRTRSSRLDPGTCGGNKFLMCKRRQRACSAIAMVSGVEGPQHERLFLVMFQESRAIEMVIFGSVDKRAADLGARQSIV